ncbi:MAG: hypothetical protein NVV82_22440 [Sporocytophaga sp.]|nr:hypothetical protein [Sporocytophaga sp.]
MKININKLKTLWDKEGVWGEWRNLLKLGYDENEKYFEFGLMMDYRRLDAKIIVNHFYHINLSSDNMKINPDWTILKGNHQINPNLYDGGIKLSIVEPNIYENMIEDAKLIFEEYKTEDTICFWSIPNKWFKDTSLVKFIEENLPKDIPESSPRQDWYWP